jgi:small conductance mechanosensitive channel
MIREWLGLSEPLWRVLMAVLIILFTPLVVKIFRVITRGALGRFSPVLSSRVQAIGVWLIWGCMIIFAISQLYLEVITLLLIVALVGLALILAARDFLSNLFMEQFLTAETFFKLGDWIQVGEHFGRVVRIDPINTVIITPNNEQVMIPNSVFQKEVIINLTSKEGVRVTVPVAVSRKCDLSKVERGLLDICQKVRDELVSSKKPEVTISELTETSVHLNINLWILNPGRRNYVVSKLIKDAKEFLDKIK